MLEAENKIHLLIPEQFKKFDTNFDETANQKNLLQRISAF